MARWTHGLTLATLPFAAAALVGCVNCECDGDSVVIEAVAADGLGVAVDTVTVRLDDEEVATACASAAPEDGEPCHSWAVLTPSEGEYDIRIENDGELLKTTTVTVEAPKKQPFVCCSAFLDETIQVSIAD